MFRIEAGGILELHVPTFEEGPPTGMTLARASCAFSIEVSTAGLKAFVRRTSKSAPKMRDCWTSMPRRPQYHRRRTGSRHPAESRRRPPGTAVEYFSFSVGGRLTLNTTGEPQEVPISPNLLEYIPDDFKAKLPAFTGNPAGKSLIVPAGPPQRCAAKVRPVPTSSQSCRVTENCHCLRTRRLPSFRNQHKSNSAGHRCTASVGPIGGVAANGTLIIDSSGVVGSLQIVSTMEIGPASLKAASQLELNTRSTSASVTRYEYDFNQNKVSKEETASIAPLTYRIFSAGKAEISNVARISGMYEFDGK
ncbi:MAG UNVERIFIED_CONTAM: hypothetical protein LVR18_39910 [Planctomycetaceae bacterium]|jgi:hypothetical protein